MNPQLRQAFIAGAEAHISSLGTTLYGQAWDVTKPERLRQCAENLVDELEAVMHAAALDHYSGVLEQALAITDISINFDRNLDSDLD